MEISVKVHADSDSSPTDSDCYTADDIAKFGGYWKYIGIELTVSAPGVTATASLWAREAFDRFGASLSV